MARELNPPRRARPITRSPTRRSLLDCGTPTVAKALADPKNDPIAPRGDPRITLTASTPHCGLLKRCAAKPSQTSRRIAEICGARLSQASRTAERDDILAYYHTLRDKDSLSHEEAIRDSIVSVLMSPDFLYRIDLLDTGANAAPGSATHSPGGCNAFKPGRSGQGPAGSVIELRDREPFELFPVVQHARSRNCCGTPHWAICAGRKCVLAQDPPHVEGPARARSRHRIRRQLARFPPFRNLQLGRPRAFPELHQRTARGHVSRSRSALWRT